MKLLKQENGVTLLEVLLALAILSIVLISFMSMFPQMGMMNKHNEDKTQAINLAKEILIKWQESDEVSGFLISADPAVETTGFISEDPAIDYSSFKNEGGFYYFETSKDIYKVKIKIKNSPNNSSRKSHIHSITVQLLNDKGNVVSETYGYIKR
jgi:prepilin-type N-terminal cleavage/methylation domain-containing protein